MKKRIVTMVLLLVLSLGMAAPAVAAEPAVIEPKASEYISTTSGYISGMGGGKLRITFTTTGTSVMTAIGATTIKLYDDTTGTKVKTYNYQFYPSMIGSGTILYSSYFEYEGVSGHAYYAEITYYAGDTTGSDSKTYTTETVVV